MAMDSGPRNTGQDTAGGDAGGRDAGGCGDHEARARRANGLPDPRKLAQDWIALWQSELAALAVDPEIHESWQTVTALWAGTISALLRTLPRASGHDSAEGYSRAADAPRAAPTAAAPDARDDAIERLTRHVASLERRLAELERGGDPKVHPKRRSGRAPRR